MDLTAIASAVASVAAPSPAIASPAVLAPADGVAAARFAEIMRSKAPLAPDDLVGPAAGAASVAGPPAVTGSERPLNIGESILSALQNVSEDMRRAHARIHAALDPQGAPLTLQQGLALQFQVSVTSLQYDLVGKVVSKSIQNVDQMVKMQ